MKVHLLKEEDDGSEVEGKKFDITKFNYQFKDSLAFKSRHISIKSREERSSQCLRICNELLFKEKISRTQMLP